MNETVIEKPASIEQPVSAGGDTLTFKEGWPCFREHSLVEAAVREAARELQVSREMAMMCAFGAMATACQSHVDVRMPTGHKIPTSLMLLTIADSGERKTTTQNYFFEAINALNDAAYRANELALVEHRIEHQLWNTRKRHLERMYSKHATQEDEASTRDALEAVAKHVRTEPQPGSSGKFLYEDTTPQALLQMLNENTPNGCLLTSEASSIFSGKALGELDKLNTLWDGSSVIVDRITRPGFILRNARLTLSLMAQPSVITRFMGKRGEEARGTGFLARFLIVKPRPMAGQRADEKLSELERRQAFNARIRERLASTVSPERQVLCFSEKASDLWYGYSKQLEKQMRENDLYHYLKDHASKLLENASRLAAILHTFERTSDNDTQIDHFTLEFCWTFAKICSMHFIEHLGNEPQIVTDTNHLAHYLMKAAYENTLPADKHAPCNRNGGKTDWSQTHPSPPNYLRAGKETTFTLTQVKQFAHSSLRGRANGDRLEAAIELLTKMGHITKNGSRYRFHETILLKTGEPALKNGEFLTIKELPLFSEQENWQPKRTTGLVNLRGYYIKVR